MLLEYIVILLIGIWHCIFPERTLPLLRFESKLREYFPAKLRLQLKVNRFFFYLLKFHKTPCLNVFSFSQEREGEINTKIGNEK